VSWGTAREGSVREPSLSNFRRPAQKKPRPTSRSFRRDEVRRGCEQYALHYRRELGFFVIALEEVFSFRADWHQDERANPLVRQYQTALDSVLESDPDLSGCAVSCCHCGIRFLTHPRCAGRLNLRCPFGCRKHHRRQASRQRSATYRQTEAGKAKKKQLNARRSFRSASTDSLPQTDAPPPVNLPPKQPAEPLPMKEELRLEDVVLDAESLRNSPMLPYVRMLVNLIEGIRLSVEELVELLIQTLRQHSIAFRRRADYVLRFLHEHPP
jgi:hypothetical protein